MGDSRDQHPGGRILVSTNLLDWQPAGTLTTLAGTVQFISQDGTNYSRRFYRCVIP